MEIVFQLPDLPAVVQQVWQAFCQYPVWALEGDMGAGKTTFVHALCNYLQVTDAVSSPTYAIVNEYSSPVAGPVYHMDWYRLKNEEEALQAGMEEYLQGKGLCLVEWPQQAAGLLPGNTLRLRLQAIDTTSRRLTVPA